MVAHNAHDEPSRHRRRAVVGSSAAGKLPSGSSGDESDACDRQNCEHSSHNAGRADPGSPFPTPHKLIERMSVAVAELLARRAGRSQEKAGKRPIRLVG